MSFDRLIEKIIEKQNPSVAGLDPKLSYIPSFIREEAYRRCGKTPEGAAEAILAYNKGLIDALSPIVPAVKPQCAYYEAYGWQGMRALQETIAYAREKGLFVITDGKRNDIGTTMEAYSAAHLGRAEVEEEAFPAFDGDALTVNGYLGSDGIRPLLKDCEAYGKGIFVLVKTSNPSSGELQNLQFEGGETLYATMGRLCEQWGETLPGWAPWLGQPTPSSCLSCGTAFPAPSSWCRAMGPRAAARVTCCPALTPRGWAPSSMLPAPSSAPGRRRGQRKRTMLWRRRRRPAVCGTSSSRAWAAGSEREPGEEIRCTPLPD